ncbi:MAG: alcohol dehydrogenase catalytic domain-containing protein [Candidatus Marinimicrobia bacterium]|nr:alcohol dehydrogenase catalytic domain-containing protein [Candidatus Neomarinimicrobiota bacterium]MCF7827420.1 alcohol dehydrogenase catalytic domain-containing protein [Candidatus Neomarinimicrobiota bacterium]MCF7881347.1 alcohol dehydrogenase catalytic domain-containing protein [Candidatus Neomarinimicrobiota bacterium]
MKAAVLTEYGQFRYKEVPTPETNEDQVLVKVGYASICGTDLHVFGGNFTERTSLPLILGHEFAGTVVETGANVTTLQTGDRVAVDPIIWCGECLPCRNEHYPACENLKLLGIDMDGGFAEYVAVDPAMAFPVGDSVSDRHAALVEVCSIGFHATNRAQVTARDSLAIWGVGRVGQCILQASRTKTNEPIFAIDVIEERIQHAAEFNDNVIPINAQNENPLQLIKEKTGGHGVDIAFESVGHAKEMPEISNPVQGAISSIRNGGTVCVLGLGNEPSEILTKELVLKEASLITSRVTHGEFREAIAAMEAGQINPESLVSAEYLISEIQDAVTALKASPQKFMKVLLQVNG